MASERGKPQRVTHPEEQTWLRGFVGYHCRDCITEFCEADLGGLSLVEIVEAIAHGDVVSSEKDEFPGAVCAVEYRPEKSRTLWVSLRFVANEERLRVLSAGEKWESDHEPSHVA